MGQDQCRLHKSVWKRRHGYERLKGTPWRASWQRERKERVPWLDSHDLNSPEGAQAFLQVVKLTLTGQIGARQAIPLNGTINLLLESSPAGT